MRTVLTMVAMVGVTAAAAPPAVQSRKVEPSGRWEITVTAHSEEAPETLLARLWRFNPKGTEGRMVKRRWVMSESAQERLVFSLLDAPVIGLRASLVRWHIDRDATGVRVRFESEDGSPPEREDALRIFVRGEWRLEADTNGGTRVVHRQVNDPNTSIPDWVMKGPQQDMILKLVADVIGR